MSGMDKIKIGGIVDMKNYLKMLLVLLTFFICCDKKAAIKAEQNFTVQKSTDGEIEKGVLQLMKKFITDDPTEKEQMQAQMRIINEFGFRALPYLLDGMNSKNEKIRYYSLITVSGTIYRRIINHGKRAGKTDVFLLPLSSEEKELLQKAFQITCRLVDDTSVRIRKSAINTLSVFGKQDVVPILEKLLTDSEPEVRYQAVLALRGLGHWQYNMIKVMTGKEPKTPEEFLEFLGEFEWGLTIQAEEELKKFGKQSIPGLIKVASSDKEPARQIAIALLGEMKAEEAIPVFVNFLEKDTKGEEERYFQGYCISALFDIDTEKSIKTIEEYGLKHKNPKIRYYTASKIYELANPIVNEEKSKYPLFEKNKERLKVQAKEVLLELLKEPKLYSKLDIGLLLIRNKEKEGIQILIGLLRDRKYFGEAKSWLEDMTGQRFGEIPRIVSKKMLEEYIKKWEVWWEQNKDTFQFPEQDKSKVQVLPFSESSLETPLPEIKILINAMTGSLGMQLIEAIMKMENMGEKVIPAIPYLISMLEDREFCEYLPRELASTPSPAIAAGKVLVKVGSPAVEQLIEKMTNTRSGDVRKHIIFILAQIGDKRAIEPLLGYITSKDNSTRQQAILALKKLTGQDFGDKTEDINKWKVWWEQNKDTFQFPEQDKQ